MEGVFCPVLLKGWQPYWNPHEAVVILVRVKGADILGPGGQWPFCLYLSIDSRTLVPGSHLGGVECWWPFEGQTF